MGNLCLRHLLVLTVYIHHCSAESDAAGCARMIRDAGLTCEDQWTRHRCATTCSGRSKTKTETAQQPLQLPGSIPIRQQSNRIFPPMELSTTATTRALRSFEFNPDQKGSAAAHLQRRQFVLLRDALPLELASELFTEIMALLKSDLLQANACDGGTCGMPWVNMGAGANLTFEGGSSGQTSHVVYRLWNLLGRRLIFEQAAKPSDVIQHLLSSVLGDNALAGCTACMHAHAQTCKRARTRAHAHPDVVFPSSEAPGNLHTDFSTTPGG